MARINGHGWRFQASVAMIKPTRLLNPNGFTSHRNDKTTVLEEFID